MNKYFCEIYNEKNDQSDEWWENFKKKTCIHKKLYFMSCFQVACKVNSHPNSLKISQVLEFLHIIDKNYEYTQDVVSSIEIEILKKVGFRMPFYTPVYCIEILLAAINFLKLPFNGSREPIEYRGTLFTTSMQLLDLAYFEHEKLYHHFQLYLGFYKNASMCNQEKELRLRVLKSNTLFLSAAIVLCARYILYPNISDTTDKIIVVNLAKLVNARNIDVIVMANILFQIIQ
ncbi:hypothetical protein EAG_06286 [Camponotus floridanus]|uniref:Cyclin N-terminal domain-containing protein 1 n=2 Tax=Camponotus floridanus TaxID=104421 RepID=E2AJR9_CAMFO|nr:hypothetical protein EAG_06286 [Camponotus floridanus]